MQLVDQFFLKFASYIIIASVLVLHILGYLMTIILHGRYNWSVWCSVAVIDMLFGFRCGKLVENFYKRVLHDAITGVGNRTLFNLKYPTDTDKSSQTSVLLLDLDNFKNINDKYGHSVGDKVLIEFVGVLKRNTRVNDTIVRWGGEEFVIILPSTGAKEASIIAERIRLAIEEAKIYVNSNSNMIKITASIGIATGDSEESGHAVVSRADKALYKAKEKRNFVLVWNKSLNMGL